MLLPDLDLIKLAVTIGITGVNQVLIRAVAYNPAVGNQFVVKGQVFVLVVKLDLKPGAQGILIGIIVYGVGINRIAKGPGHKRLLIIGQIVKSGPGIRHLNLGSPVYILFCIIITCGKRNFVSFPIHGIRVVINNPAQLVIPQMFRHLLLLGIGKVFVRSSTVRLGKFAPVYFKIFIVIGQAFYKGGLELIHPVCRVFIMIDQTVIHAVTQM